MGLVGAARVAAWVARAMDGRGRFELNMDQLSAHGPPSILFVALFLLPLHHQPLRCNWSSTSSIWACRCWRRQPSNSRSISIALRSLHDQVTTARLFGRYVLIYFHKQTLAVKLYSIHARTHSCLCILGGRSSCQFI
jgi:hypothetical protein